MTPALTGMTVLPQWRRPATDQIVGVSIAAAAGAAQEGRQRLRRCRPDANPRPRRRRGRASRQAFRRCALSIPRRWEMDERQKLQSDLKRYRTLRDLIHDEPATATLEE